MGSLKGKSLELSDPYERSLVMHAIANHNRKVHKHFKFVLVNFLVAGVTSFRSHVQHRFLITASILASDDTIEILADVNVSNEDEDMFVSSFFHGNRESNSHESSTGINMFSTGILSDRISTPTQKVNPSTNIEGKTIKDCELELKAMRTSYEHLNLFSKYHLELHSKALYDGYQLYQKNRQRECYGLRITFTLEDLEDEYNKTLVKFAIAKHNRKFEESCRLTFRQLLYVDIRKTQSYLVYHFFFVAHTLSEELRGYYAEVKATGIGSAETIHAKYFCRIRNTNEGGSGSSCEKVKQSHESSIGILSHRIPTPIQIEDQLVCPKKTMEKKRKLTMADRINEFNKRQNHLLYLTDRRKESYVDALVTGYKRRRTLRRCLKTGNFMPFLRFDVLFAFTLEDLEDEYHKVLVEYAIAKHNKEVNDDSKLALVELMHMNSFTISGRKPSVRYDICFVAEKGSNGELVAYLAEVWAVFPHEDLLVKLLFCLGGPISDGIRYSLEEGKQSDDSCRGTNLDTVEDRTGSARERETMQ